MRSKNFGMKAEIRCIITIKGNLQCESIAVDLMVHWFIPLLWRRGAAKDEEYKKHRQNCVLLYRWAMGLGGEGGGGRRRG